MLVVPWQLDTPCRGIAYFEIRVSAEPLTVVRQVRLPGFYGTNTCAWVYVGMSVIFCG